MEHTGQGRMGALMEAMDLLEQLPPTDPVLRERGLHTESDYLDALADPDATVRRGCLEHLAGTRLAAPRTDDAVPRVIERLADPEWIVRYTAVHALTHVVDGDVLPAAITTVRTDSSTYVRMLAVELVAGVPDPDGLAAETLAGVRDGDADAGVRRKAARYTPD